MTTDLFTEAARAGFANDWRWKRPRSGDPATQRATELAVERDRELFIAGAFWARDHLAAQEPKPTEAEVEAATRAIESFLDKLERGDWDGWSVGLACAALRAARDARRDEEDA